MRRNRRGFRLQASGFRSSPLHGACSLEPAAPWGFTLVEIMLVVIIIAVLAAMVVPRFAGRTEQAKLARTKSDIAAIGVALDLYELDVGQYPESLPELTTKEPPAGLSQELKAQWRGPYLKRGLPQDPWGREYQYARQSQHQQDYDLYSFGSDGKPGNDDVTNWE
ncbi:MAG: type II secretion system major pseudopilin GspG [Candidatus Omnitrophica bacterium]|nr:type II secretion system major pseudopilin GspG [Candidatus Omnitrophota bacterium]